MPKQQTPTGYEIPVPSREDFMANLRKVAKPVPRPAEPDDESSDAGGAAEQP